MRKAIIFVVAIVLLFLIPALILRAIYGPSYYFLSGEDCWMPDGTGGWTKHSGAGFEAPPPQEPSINIPLVVMYIPVLLPGLLTAFILCMFLSKKFKRRKLICEKQ
jgi:hypothetical protein